MEELWNKLGAWGYAVPILMLLCLNILLFTDIFEKIIGHGTISRNLGRKAEPEDCLKRTREK